MRQGGGWLNNCRMPLGLKFMCNVSDNLSNCLRKAPPLSSSQGPSCLMLVTSLSQPLTVCEAPWEKFWVIHNNEASKRE